MNKGLKALKDFKSQQAGVNVYANEYLDIIEKELKALELIEVKEVDPTMIYDNYNNYEGYLAAKEEYYVMHQLKRDKEEWNRDYVLTREEFDFLSDVLFGDKGEEDEN